MLIKGISDYFGIKFIFCRKNIKSLFLYLVIKRKLLKTSSFLYKLTASSASKFLIPFVFAIFVNSSLASLFLPVERSQNGDSGINLFYLNCCISFIFNHKLIVNKNVNNFIYS